jgi:hypothetical protein
MMGMRREYAFDANDGRGSCLEELFVRRRG